MGYFFNNSISLNILLIGGIDGGVVMTQKVPVQPLRKPGPHAKHVRGPVLRPGN